jgi:catechol 2,3-dioxygenase-like lactoylglutathione lyase family enzyme
MNSSHHLVRTFHSTCMVSDYDATVAALGRIVGLRVLEYSENEVIGRRGGMTWIGDNSLEVAQPIVEGHAAERFLRRLGPGMHSYALQVSDLDATISHLEAGGVTVGVRPAPGFCFTDPRTTGGLLFEWSNFTVEEDPRVGAELPTHPSESLLDVRNHAFVGAVVPDPLQWAETFGPLFGLSEAFRHVGAAPGEPVVGLAAPDCLIALYPLPGADSHELWGSELTRGRFHVLGVGVANLGTAAQCLIGAGLKVVRQSDSAVVVDPAASGEVPLVLMQELLPGDPREPRAFSAPFQGTSRPASGPTGRGTPPPPADASAQA